MENHTQVEKFRHICSLYSLEMQSMMERTAAKSPWAYSCQNIMGVQLPKIHVQYRLPL